MPTAKATPEEIDHYTKVCLDRGGKVGGPGYAPPVVERPYPSVPARVPTPQLKPIISASKEYLLIQLPILTKSEANQGGNWKGKSKRTKDARRQVSLLCGPHLRKLAWFAEHYHRGGTLKATFTRMGGRHLDPMANLGHALKATEDAICLMLGVDDGDPRWVAVPKQELGGDVGVRIEITLGSNP